MKCALQRHAERGKIEMQLQADRERSQLTHNNAGFIGARILMMLRVCRSYYLLCKTSVTFFNGLE